MMTEENKQGELPEKLTRVFLKIRDKRAEMKAAFDVEDKKLTAQQDKVKSALLDFCKANGLDSVKTSAGTFFRTVKTRLWTNDWDAMNEFIREHDVPEFYEKRLNQTAVKQFIDDELGGETPEFINVKSEYQISVRKSK
jgi:hypothetical protein